MATEQVLWPIAYGYRACPMTYGYGYRHYRPCSTYGHRTCRSLLDNASLLSLCSRSLVACSRSRRSRVCPCLVSRRLSLSVAARRSLVTRPSLRAWRKKASLAGRVLPDAQQTIGASANRWTLNGRVRSLGSAEFVEFAYFHTSPLKLVVCRGTETEWRPRSEALSRETPRAVLTYVH